MTTLFKHGISNKYKVEFEETRLTDPDGDEFTSVTTKKYLRKGDKWLLIYKDLYMYWDIELITRYYIESLGYKKEE